MFTATLSALHVKDATALERTFAHLTASALETLETDLGGRTPGTARTIGRALLRRKVHAVLDKSKGFGDVDAGLDIELPLAMRSRCLKQYGGLPPTTWRDCLSRLEELSGGSREQLWSHVIAHPMTEYVPNQCQHCGHIVPDETTPGYTDAEVGISEVPPTASERPFVRGGYYRGARSAVVFLLQCPECGEQSRWFRSSAAQVVLNPNRWGRLCGEQEDLRAALARHLGVPLRAILPLDWDHVWSETRHEDDGAWAACQGPGDAPAANFAGRLDEGIGAWTRVVAVSADAEETLDVTEQYLSCRSAGGRADERLDSEMARYREVVGAARTDASGSATQAKTLNGHVLHRAGFGREEVTRILRQAVADHGMWGWWEWQEEAEADEEEADEEAACGPTGDPFPVERRSAPLLLDAHSFPGVAFGLTAYDDNVFKPQGGYTIEDVPLTALFSGRELTMVVLADRNTRRVLLEVRNDLGWRLHFGCVGVSESARPTTKATVDGRWAAAEEAAAAELAAAGILVGSSALRRAGVMLFSFPSHPPLRVRVLEANLADTTTPSTQPPPGVYYDFDQVPYDRMWADDIVWMPMLLSSEASYFEGHFVFDGAPGAASKLVRHNSRAM
mmetsp:Transcript_14343/g.48265  ORF Transcript_14343/g.48265 Transcript_14343/m.48265 type:complete len:618 (+) Transcript_14343:80-1933(+)